MYQKLKAEMDCDCRTVDWLDYDTEVNGRKKTVTKLQCTVCTKFKASIALRRNVSDKWLVGVESVCTKMIMLNQLKRKHA